MSKIPFIPSLAKPTLVVLCCVISLSAMAQQGTEAASALRDSGKIYVVVGVVLLIFIGLVIYLIRVDRKVKRLEEAQNDKSSEQ